VWVVDVVAGWLDQVAATGDDGLLYRLGQVVPQVPAIGDLDRRGRACAGAVSVGTGAVPAHDADPGVLFEPTLEGVRGAVREHVQRPVGVDVDDDRAVDVPAA
jgi:hypothetical protein